MEVVVGLSAPDSLDDDIGMRDDRRAPLVDNREYWKNTPIDPMTTIAPAKARTAAVLAGTPIDTDGGDE